MRYSKSACLTTLYPSPAPCFSSYSPWPSFPDPTQPPRAHLPIRHIRTSSPLCAKPAHSRGHPTPSHPCRETPSSTTGRSRAFSSTHSRNRIPSRCLPGPPRPLPGLLEISASTTSAGASFRFAQDLRTLSRNLLAQRRNSHRRG